MTLVFYFGVGLDTVVTAPMSFFIWIGADTVS
jgi:hypothetical protein